ncbi:lymphocyte-specific protein 1 isoform X2 [Tenrec ecaudatus]|uniref:lymphocyte-specific protein 1 isoform X2 n=1 Tax=Tenrec ecaudatus TaxID=94439 RepID=UPI003F5ACF2A
MAEAVPTEPGSEEREELLVDEAAGLNTQWSMENEEEAARERLLQVEDSSPQAPELEQDKLLSPKSSEMPEVDEDEGFGEWSQRPGQRGLPTEDSGREVTQEATSQELEPEETLPHRRQQEDVEPGKAPVPLEELCLSPEGEPREGPEEPVQGPQEPVEAEEAEEELPRCQQPRTPSPLTLEKGPGQSTPPQSPTTKLLDQTETLSGSLKQSNNEKSEPALPVSKIDGRLEQYTQAIETAGRTSKLARQPSVELPSMTVASTKNLWETGEVQAQSTAKGASCKDIVAGDMSKRSLWEQRGGPKTASSVKSTPSGKRYKFVATGHGKYEKVLVGEGAAP